MKTIPSNLSPRGWALLVLAGGSTLAIPFFKGSSSDGKYSTVSTSPANKPDENNPTFNKAMNVGVTPSPQPKPLINSQFQAQASLPNVPKVDSPSPKKVMAQVLESSSEHTSAAPTKPALINQPERRTTTQASTAGGSSSGLDDTRNAVLGMSSQNKTGQVDELPKPAASSRTEGDRADTSVVVSQPRSKDPSTATPVPTEFPSWAKKPSLLDSLLNGKPSSSEQDTLDARKPTSFQTWADNNPDGVTKIAPTDSADRYTPFGQVDQNISLTKTDSTAQVRWPDEDPRTAVAVAQPPKLVGRDAMIRDPEKLQSPSSTRSPAVLSATVSSANTLPGTGSTSPGKEFGKAPSTITQPRFGEQPKNVEKPRASLRSQLPPNEQQIIRQPSLKADR